MFYRLFIVGIVVFWLLMAALLVRTELFPDRDYRLPMPVDYVGRLVFRHEQPSDLVMSYQRHRLDGTFHVQPKRVPASGDGKTPPTNLLNVSGNLPLTLPSAGKQRIVFHGSLEVDDHEQVERVDLSLSIHEPKQAAAAVTLHFDGRPAQNQWHYQLTRGNTTLLEGDGTPEAMLGSVDLRAYGIDPQVFSPANQQMAVTLTAHRGVLRVGDEDIETYVLLIRQGDNLETAIHINQLGQILAVKTFLGYDLYDETLAL